MLKIMKFGGTSVKDADRIIKMCEIVTEESKTNQVHIVCSAMKGITDELIKSGKLAEKRDDSYKGSVETIRARQKDAVSKLFIDTQRQEIVLSNINKMIKELEEILVGVYLVKSCSVRSLDLISGLGERLNNYLISEYLNSIGNVATYVDARTIIKTDDNFGSANVDLNLTENLTKNAFKNIKGIGVITGFISSTHDDISTTLGRNGSDYTASIIGFALDADIVEIWTDVDGVLSADPRVVKNARVIPEISIQEAMELSYFGAEVIHPSTMRPAVKKNIPIVIKNTMNPNAPGTKIIANPKSNDFLITGLASTSNIAMVNIEGSGMIGRRGFAAEVFTLLAEAQVNIIMITQCSSEHSICFACKESESKIAKQVLEERMFKDSEGVINRISIMKNLSTISIIGNNMVGRPGMAGKLFNALGEKSINVLAIAQGSSELNISIIVESRDEDLALKTIHDAFM